MDTESPFYMFEKGTPPSLIRAHDHGLYVDPADVEEAWEDYPAEHENPDFVALLEKARGGQLRSRAGRPRKGSVHFLRHVLAQMEVERLVRLYRAAKARGSAAFKHVDFDRMGMMEFIHERVARKLRLGTGRALQDELSKMRRGKYFM